MYESSDHHEPLLDCSTPVEIVDDQQGGNTSHFGASSTGIKVKFQKKQFVEDQRRPEMSINSDGTDVIGGDKFGFGAASVSYLGSNISSINNNEKQSARPSWRDHTK